MSHTSTRKLIKMKKGLYYEFVFFHSNIKEVIQYGTYVQSFNLFKKYWTSGLFEPNSI